MEKVDRMRLVNAIIKAKNAFYNTLEKEGYHIEYGLGKDLITGCGAIVDESLDPHEHRIVGHITFKTDLAQ